MMSDMANDIQKLKDAITEIEKGNYDMEVPENLSGELGDLANYFNVMTRGIKKTINDLVVDRQRYKNLYDSSPELHRSVNADHIILDCNDSYAKELGYTKEDVIGHSVFEHTADHSLDAHHEMIDSWAKNKKVSNTELWFKRKDGSTFPVILSSNGLLDASGKLIGSNTVIVDITEIFEARKKIVIQFLETKQYFLDW